MTAEELNQLFLDEMHTGRTSTMMLVRDLWWAKYEEDVGNSGILNALDQLDTYMDVGREALFHAALQYASSRGHGLDTDAHRQASMQFLKSNTGKMFERFVGLALSFALAKSNAPYCVLPFRKEMLELCHGLAREDFAVSFLFGDGSLSTLIDADLFAFNPADSDEDIYLISIKSTLKDRFHNVPFWNLLRRAAVSTDFTDIAANNPDLLRRVKYVAVCSDLANEQPDFGSESGPRNLLKIDAALLDGAYVTASRARGLPADCGGHLGEVREHAFYRYSCFFSHLSKQTRAT